MRYTVLAVALLVLAPGLGSCDRGGNHSRHSADASSQTTSTPAQVEVGPLCALVNDGRASLSQLGQQINSESNPLKQADAQASYRQKADELNTRLLNFLNANSTLEDSTGTIGPIDYKTYNQGPGVNLNITLSCGVTVFVRFLDVTDPAWGQFDPNQFAQLSAWRTVLENLSSGDTVTFSARIIPSPGGPYAFPQPGGSLTLWAIITQLQKN